MTVSSLALGGIAAHLVADWFLQNHWIAENKHSLRHPAAWVHGGCHFLCLWPVFGAAAAGTLALLHMLVDTRRPLNWWRRTIRQTTEGPAALHVAIWQDQAAHLLLILAAAFLMGRG